MSQFTFYRSTIVSLMLLLGVALTISWFARVGEAADPCAVANFNLTTISVNSSSPTAIVTDDFNHDGKLDLATVNHNSAGTIGVLLGNGSGGFSGPTTFNGGRSALFLASGDLNGDSHVDLVTANESSFQGALHILLGNGSGGFGFPIQVLQGAFSITTAVAIGDVNGDTAPDVVFTNSSQHLVTILLNNGTGTFTFFKSFSVGGSVPHFLLMRDLNGDTKLDLAVANLITQPGGNVGGIGILLGDGAGNFGTATNFVVSNVPNAIAAGDFNGDTKLDLAAISASPNKLFVLIGDGTGQFGAAANFDVAGINAQGLAQSDFNGDGKIDLAVTNAFPGGVVIFSGDGSGGFTATSHFRTGTITSNMNSGRPTMVSADFNNDGRSDLAVASEVQRLVSVLLNSCGSPVPSELQFSFLSYAGFETQFVGGTTFTLLRTGEITGTASVDYTTADGTATSPADYALVSGTATFAPGETFKMVSIPIVDDNITETAEDFNLLLSNVTGSATLGNPNTALVFIQDNDPAPAISVNDVTVQEFDNGTGNAIFTVTLDHPSSFTVTVNYTTVDGSASGGSDYQVTSGTLTFNPFEVSKNISVPVNGDLQEEITETFFLNLSAPVNGSLGAAQGVGTITDDDSTCPAPSFNTAPDIILAGGSQPGPLTKADFNNDGKVDLASANFVHNNVSVMLGNGSGGFSSPTNFAVGSNPRSFAVSDLNLDGKVDLIVAARNPSADSNQISVLLGNGAGGFAPAVTTSPVTTPYVIAAGDLNLDGKPDIAVASISTARVFVLLGDGAGGFGVATGFNVGTSPLFVALADFNNDSKPDIVVANQNSDNVSVLLGNGDGTFASALNVAAGQNPQAVAVGDFNSDGKADLAVANLNSKDVSILLGNGSGGFQAANSLAVSQRAISVITADLNGDGKLDLMVPNYDAQFVNGFMAVSFGSGTGGFSIPTEYQVGFSPTSVAAGDFNGDGKLEPAVTNLLSDRISVFLNACSTTLPSTVIRFSAANWVIGEGSGSIAVTINRIGNTHVGSSVDYTTSDTASANCNVKNGKASSRCDYLTSIGTLRFAANETSKVISIPTVDDSYAEGNETFTVVLSNPVDATLGSPDTAVVTITDNESMDGSNLIDQASIFVRQHYIDFLNREPDASGLEFWSNQIIECEQVGATCSAEVRRINVSAAFFLSIEFQETGYLVERFYKTAYGDALGTSNSGPSHQLPVPIIRFNEFLPDTQRIGKDVVVGVGDWQARLEANKVVFGQEFVSRARFSTAHPTTLSPAQFVEALFLNAGVTPSAAERNSAIAEFGGAGNTTDTAARAHALRRVAEHATLAAQEKNRAFVLMQYYGYLRRDPNQAPDSDYSGYDFWLTKLNQFNGNFVEAEMVKAFITSGEYRQRFGP